jgi:hypothetical protein
MFLAVSVVLLGALDPAAGQVGRLQVARFPARVLWIAGEKMMVTTDCMFLENCAPVSVAIDLRRVPLSEYRGVRAGTWVLVTAIVSHRDGQHQVTATSIMQIEEWEAP